MRLFIAIELPAPVLRELRRVQSLLRPIDADVRWIRLEGAHLTLAFLGDVDPDELLPLDRLLAPIARQHSPFTLRLGAPGTFPASGSPRVLWVGVDDPERSLGTLHGDLRDAVGQLGFAGDRRPFRPHVTLGRARGSRGTPQLRATLAASDPTTPTWRVDAFCVFSSRLEAGGARYERVSRYPLVGSA